jgi:hypothetical protein
VVPDRITKFVSNVPVDFSLDDSESEFSVAVDATPNSHGHGLEALYAELRGIGVMPVRAYQARIGNIPGMIEVRRRFLASLEK